MKRARSIAFVALLSCLHAPHAAIGSDRDVVTQAPEDPPFLPHQFQDWQEKTNVFSLPAALFPTIASYLGWPDIAQVARVNRLLRDYVRFDLGVRTVLELSETKTTDAWLTQALSALPSLKHLSLRQCVNLTNQGIQQLSLSHPGLTNLRHLDVSRIQITDAALWNLGKLTTLTALNISNTEVTDAGFAYLLTLTTLNPNLFNLSNLRHLDVSSTQITDAALEDLGKLTHFNLRHLDIVSFRMDQMKSQGLVHLRTCTNLTSLRLGGDLITDEGLSYLGLLTHLKALDIDCTYLPNDLTPLRMLTNLTSLCLQRIQTGLRDILSPLQALTNLTSLNLSNSRIGNGSLAPLQALTQLTYLDLSGNRITDQGRETLQTHLPNVRFA